jgi:DNA-binding response OmpR family regulator
MRISLAILRDASRPCATALFLHQLRILVVDHVPDYVAVLFDFLRGHGFKVLVNERGRHALALIAPDLILLDVMMPDMDGLETCRRIKPGLAFRGCAGVFHDRAPDPLDKVRGLQLGAADYIIKPIFPEKVVARIRVHLELRDRNRELAEQNERLDAAIQQRIAAERALQHTRENAVIVADESGAVHLRTGAAEQLLQRYFGPNRESHLPPIVAAWLSDARGRAQPFAIPGVDGGPFRLSRRLLPALIICCCSPCAKPPLLPRPRASRRSASRRVKPKSCSGSRMAKRVPKSQRSSKPLLPQ